MKGYVYFINDRVQRFEGGTVEFPGDDVLTLVDAGGDIGIPNPDLLDAVNLRVLVTSFSRDREDRRWLTQFVQDSKATFVMKLWSWKEFLLTSFVYPA